MIAKHMAQFADSMAQINFGGIGIAERMLTENAVDAADGSSRVNASAVGNNLNVSTQQASQAAHVVFGSSVGITSQAVNAESRGFTIFSSGSDDYLGGSVSGIGDVNGDGLADLLVGARDRDTLFGATAVNTGRAYIIYGKTSFTAVNVDSTLTADIGRIIAADSSTMRGVGDKVVGAGDVNGDGYDEVAIGADQHSAGQLNEGRVAVYRGSNTGITSDRFRFQPPAGAAVLNP